ncbi:restriction endonuclease subunit S, partial [Patescibacteria group bacterium]|nr:restriction endonuclease subunit S [Patescibacteria group bacterium]
ILGGYAFKSTTYKPNGKYGIVTIKNVQQSKFIPQCTDYIDESPNAMNSHCLLANGDILLSLTGNVGRVCLVYGENYLLNQRVAKIVPKKTIPKSYAYWLFDNSVMQKRIENLSHGAAQQNLSPIKLGNQIVILPLIELLKIFGDSVSLINAETITLLKQNQKLAQARDLLLPRLMSGAIEV